VLAKLLASKHITSREFEDASVLLRVYWISTHNTVTVANKNERPLQSVPIGNTDSVSREEVHPEEEPSIDQLKAKLQNLKAEWNTIERNKRSDAEQEYIKLLHEYNELKDAGVQMLGRLAEVEGTTSTEMYQRYGLKLDD